MPTSYSDFSNTSIFTRTGKTIVLLFIRDISKIQINTKSTPTTDQHRQHHQVLPDAGGEPAEREYQQELGKQCSSFASTRFRSTTDQQFIITATIINNQALPDAGGEVVEREYQQERGRQSCCCSSFASPRFRSTDQ